MAWTLRNQPVPSCAKHSPALLSGWHAVGSRTTLRYPG
jgi:hypothetical protein